MESLNMISDLIKARLKKAGKRYYASDNIAEFLHEGEKEKLVEELTEKFSGVLDSLVIDSDNDPNSQGTAKRLARYIGAPYEETGHWVAGVNHQAWYLRFEWNGEDAYPLLWEKMRDPEIYQQDVVRFEMMKSGSCFSRRQRG